MQVLRWAEGKEKQSREQLAVQVQETEARNRVVMFRLNLMMALNPLLDSRQFWGLKMLKVVSF